MHIVMFSGSFPPEIGGIQTHLYNLSRALLRHGHEVKVVTIRRERTQPWRACTDGLEVFRVPVRNVPKTLTIQFLTFSAALIMRLHRTWQVDLVHCHTFWPDVSIAFALRALMPTIYTVHESSFLIMAEQGRFQRRLRLALSPFDAVIAPSSELLDVARKFGVPAETSTFISNAVDPDRFSPDVAGSSLRQSYHLPENATLLVCPRRLVPKNGVEYLVKALPLILRRSSNVFVLVAGDGPERTRLNELVHALGLERHVFFAGSIENDRMPSVYADADIVVIPSLKEATSIAGLEAMSSGRPIVATRVGGLPEIVRDGVTGLLVLPQDPDGLADAILQLEESPERRRAMGLAARARVLQQFNWATVAERTEQVYQAAIKSRHREPGRRVVGSA